MRTRLGILILCVAVILAACSGQPPEVALHLPGTATASPNIATRTHATSTPVGHELAGTPVPAVTVGSTKHLRIALVVPRLGDKGLFDSAASGIRMARDRLGADTVIVQTGSDTAKQERALTKLAQENYDLIITGASDKQAMLKRVAGEFPKQKFIFFDAVVDLPNVANITFAQNQSSFLAGVLAACVSHPDNGTKNLSGLNVIGVVGGEDTPVVNDFIVGYKQGAKYVDPDITVLISYAGSFDDPDEGRKLANRQFQQGANVVFQVAGKTGLGVLQAARNNHRYAIGADANQNNLYPGTVLTSVLKRVDTAIFDLVQMEATSTLATGKTYAYRLQNNGVGLATDANYYQYVPETCQKLVEQARKDIASGRVQVKTAPSTADDMPDSLQPSSRSAYNPATRSNTLSPLKWRVSVGVVAASPPT